MHGLIEDQLGLIKQPSWLTPLDYTKTDPLMKLVWDRSEREGGKSRKRNRIKHKACMWLYKLATVLHSGNETKTCHIPNLQNELQWISVHLLTKASKSTALCELQRTQAMRIQYLLPGTCTTTRHLHKQLLDRQGREQLWGTYIRKF